MIYACCDERRREAVRAHPSLNGIDFLEVLDGGYPVEALRQQTLLVRLLKPTSVLSAANVVMEGGERVKNIATLWAVTADALTASQIGPAEQAYFATLTDTDRILVVRTAQAGDFSLYTLRLVDAGDAVSTPANFDPLLTSVVFSFKVECPTEFDCLAPPACIETSPLEPDLNYLAKDYGTFRRLMLDRMAQLMPDWTERSPADLGITLVEMLAYVGDHLSYQQDAVATEAYLGTARRRVSVRRHARLVDYAMHDGLNARAFLQVSVDADGVTLDASTQVLSRVPAIGARIPPLASAPDYEEAMRSRPVVFETMQPITCYAAHNEIPFYVWGDHECCLARGATRATLAGHLPHLAVGDLLIFEELRDPDSGQSEDADPRHRHVVRLVTVVSASTGGQPLQDPLNNAAITEIAWHAEDALPFALCISARTDTDHGGAYIENVSVARGNIVLADHGRSIGPEALGTVPEPHLFLVPKTGTDGCARPAPVAIPPRFRPLLAEAPLTQAVPLPDAATPLSATALMQGRPGDARPEITLDSLSDGLPASWSAERDLLGSIADDRHFVAELESDGTVQLRFGDDLHGMRPDSGTVFTASYRVGNGTAGNVGPESLAHIVTAESAVQGVRNPLRASGGVEPESIAAVRQNAPQAFRTQERAVTEADYAAASQRLAGIQRAAATFRWTGSWHTVFVTADRSGGLDVDQPFEDTVRGQLEDVRMAGYDLDVDAPRYVPLELTMLVCVKPDYFRSDVKAAVLDVLGNRDLPDGRRGVFHPDNFTFGQPVYLSGIYAAVQAVPGVDSVTIQKFQRQGLDDPKPLQDGFIGLGRLEIARLDNDRNFPERGVLRLSMGGGK